MAGVCTDAFARSAAQLREVAPGAQSTTSATRWQLNRLCNHAWGSANHLHRHGTAQRRSQVQATGPKSADTAVQLAEQHVIRPTHTHLADPAHSKSHTTQTFVWTRCWYPLLVVQDLDAAKPYAATLLGKNLVLWRDSQGAWRCFDDECPHRLAPLSEGRAEADGTLRCSYHAWSFDASGACRNIPQADTPEAKATACKSRRSAVQTYPVRQQAGLLWVWPDDSPSAYIDAAAASVPLAPRYHESMEKRGPYMRDLPYGHSILLENLVDPAHLPVSHHGVSKELRRENARALPMKLVDYTPEGASPSITYQTSWPGAKPGSANALNISFVAPCHVLYDGGQNPHTVLFAVPTAPGRSRTFVSFYAPPPPPQQQQQQPSMPDQLKTLLLKSVLLPLMLQRHRLHQMHSTIFDGDAVFLSMQEHALQEKYGERWEKAYYLPSGADSIVTHVRKWLDTHAGGGPQWAQGVSPQLPPMEKSREAMLDRYDQHTRHCSSCLQRVQTLERMRAGGYACVAASFLALCARLGSAQLQAPGGFPATIAAGVVGAALIALAQAELPNYFYKGYDHTEH